jgi:3'(2'), 5'-bisphosphate nucleotidase
MYCGVIQWKKCTRYKKIGSSLIQADQASHGATVKSLSEYSFPIVSEETPEPKAIGSCYWRVDPLDGTKVCVAANHELAVNIALVKNGEPILGAFYALALD